MLRRWLLPLLLLGLTPLPAPARVRQAEPVEVCVLVPRVEAVDEGEAVGELPTATPVLLVVEPLRQVRIESAEGHLLWSSQAPASGALERPLPWPLPPLKPDQEVVLRLQPVGAADDAYAHVRLRAGDGARLKATATLISTLGRSGDAWLAAVHTALTSGDVPLAWTLLYAPQSPSSDALQALRRDLLQRGCGDAEPSA
ncbi:MAG: hypothetical protein FJ050_02960 [Cyanobacteria bacterium M_surface_7_m2_040]|nr:hypothetical protein [Cyanobacteria bacterium K_Offshore_0m_m2_072]MBM5827006.1 hypothetical protein [Cyanobacteria bacterium M_surface_7_m2_040]